MTYKFKTFFLILLICNQLSAQESSKLKGFYGSINPGIGVVKGNLHTEEINTCFHFAFHFNVGYFILRSVQAGITLNGWLFEPFNETLFAYKGESISNGMVHIQYYPIRNKRLYLKSAYGISEYTNLRPEGNHGNGDAFMIAAGCEMSIGKRNFLLGVQLSYNIGNLKYNKIPGYNVLVDRKFQATDLTILLALD
jgi:hypothetical protein